MHLYKVGKVFIKYENLSFMPCNIASVTRLVALRHQYKGAKERVHPMGLWQKQSNQPVFGQFLTYFIIRRIYWNTYKSPNSSLCGTLFDSLTHILDK